MLLGFLTSVNRALFAFSDIFVRGFHDWIPLSICVATDLLCKTVVMHL